MLSRRDILQMEALVERVTELLSENEVYPIVIRRLYLHKNGSWSMRCDGFGWDIGKPSPEKLLPQFFFALTGTEMDPSRLSEDGPLLLGRLIDHLAEAIRQLVMIKRSPLPDL